MRITKKQLRRIIRESIAVSEVMTTPAQFRALRPGDRLSLNGKSIVVVQTSSVSADIDYVEQGSSKQQYFDYRYALADDPNELPEYDVVYLGPGESPQNTRLLRR
mgnify:CR=1 FL=1